MVEELGARVLREGLVSRDQLADALAEGATGGVLAAALLRQGLSADALFGLLRREGHAVADAADLDQGAGPVSRLLHGRMAHTLQALPVADLGHEVLVAMMDPTDGHALRELRFGIGRSVRPLLAHADALHEALAMAYPGDAPPIPRETPLALVRRRGPDAAPARRKTQPMVTPAAPAQHSAAPASAPAPAPSSFEPVPRRPLPSSTPPSTGRSLISPAEASWSDLDDAPAPAPQRTPRGDQPPPIGPVLAALRRTTERDEIVRLACDGVAGVAKTVVFLALRRGVLRGWEACGPHVSADAIRNLWIPVTSPSMFQRTLERGDVYDGPFGTTAADGLFRAATGSRGGHVLLHPIRVAGKPLGVLCVEGVRFERTGRRRVEELVLAAGQAFERLFERSRP